ncbi:hypothetical protein [Ureaplasma parvum]|uniref:hypothetical protein n=1 Tax=Ureaplasma parvum TaxID=134821 RepID=UPI0026EA6B2D|nr:hypothetical protein [Ureaplasma parvum]
MNNYIQQVIDYVNDKTYKNKAYFIKKYAFAFFTSLIIFIFLLVFGLSNYFSPLISLVGVVLIFSVLVVFCIHIKIINNYSLNLLKWLRNQKELSYKYIINILDFILNKQLYLNLTIIEVQQICIDLEEFKKTNVI